MLLLDEKVVIRSPCPYVIGGWESVVLFTTMYLWAALAPRRCKTEESGFWPFQWTEIDYHGGVSLLSLQLLLQWNGRDQDYLTPEVRWPWDDWKTAEF